MLNLKESDYVTIVITVPERDADKMREVMGREGAGTLGNYTFCSFSVKGIGRFKKEDLEEVIEERIETVCSLSVLEHVLEEIKKAHPYEETVIDIYPIYEIGRKKASV